MELAHHHDTIDSENCLDREEIIDILDDCGHGFDDDESTVSLRQKLVISFRAVSGLKAVPTGCCIHALATRIHTAERLAPNAVSHDAVRWNRLIVSKDASC